MALTRNIWQSVFFADFLLILFAAGIFSVSRSSLSLIVKLEREELRP